MIILAVAGFFAWSVGRPYLNNEVSDRISSGVATQVGDIAQVTVPASGKIVLTEDDINAAIREYAGSIDPITDPVASIDQNGITIDFDLYGVSTQFRAGAAVVGGRIVLQDPAISGVAGRLIDPEDVATIVEAQLEALMTRSHLTPVSVMTSTGTLMVVTAPAAGTSV